MDWKSGFTRYTAITGLPSMSVTKNGVSFNQAAVLRMGKPHFVRLYIDAEGMRFAIEACEQPEDGTLPFYRGGDISKGVRWNNSDLKSTLERLMGWSTNKVGFKVRGTFHEEPSPALEFGLAEATTLPERGK